MRFYFVLMLPLGSVKIFSWAEIWSGLHQHNLSHQYYPSQYHIHRYGVHIMDSMDSSIVICISVNLSPANKPCTYSISLLVFVLPKCFRVLHQAFYCVQHLRASIQRPRSKQHDMLQNVWCLSRLRWALIEECNTAVGFSSLLLSSREFTGSR